MAKERLYVLDGDQKVPFLRGMITHSLMERGLTFQQAYQTAGQVRERVRRMKVVPKQELSDIIQAVVQEEFGDEVAREARTVRVRVPFITVQGPDGSLPFSKGVVAQSLQASGLEPSSAFEIARRIEVGLIEKGSPLQVSRNQLRRLAYETLLKEYDARVAERYLLWRHLKNPDRPLVLLFGGATGTGKTSVANEVAHRLGIQQVLSTDTVRQIMRMMVSQDLIPALHFSSYEAWKAWTPLREDHATAVVEAFREQSLKVLVGVRAMVDRAVRENFSLILDGVHLIPGLSGLEKYEHQAYIVPVVLSTLNRTSYLERFPIRQKEAVQRPARKYRENFENILRIQEYILEVAEQQDAPIVENQNFDETVTSILRVLSNRLREKLDLSTEELVARTL